MAVLKYILKRIKNGPLATLRFEYWSRIYSFRMVFLLFNFQVTEPNIVKYIELFTFEGTIFLSLREIFLACQPKVMGGQCK